MAEKVQRAQNELAEVESIALRKKERAYYLCCFKCCDNTTPVEDYKSCCKNCRSLKNNAHDYAVKEINNTKRLYDTCVSNCGITNRNKVPGDTSHTGEVKMSKEQRLCVIECTDNAYQGFKRLEVELKHME